jgi:parallel beta-helix repeat protein
MFSRKITTTFAATALAAAVAVFAAGPSAGSSSVPITSCGQTVTTNAVLTKNLVCTGDGIVVGASGIKIDLKGFVVQGDRGSGDYGIDDLTGSDNVTVKNGVLRDFSSGIYADGADHFNVSNVIATGNAEDGIYVQGTSASIVSSAASGNGFTGIWIVGGAASIKSSSTVGNSSYGIWVSGDGTTLKSTRAVSNVDGIDLNGNAASISSSTVAGSGQAGLYIAGNAASVKSNVVVGNSLYGIWVKGDTSKITANRADENGFMGGQADGDGAGIDASGYTTPPTGKNEARANDYPANCDPASLC